jgi:hypothetical protein
MNLTALAPHVILSVIRPGVWYRWKTSGDTLARGDYDMARSEESSTSLQDHIESTYHSLRFGIAVIGVALPLVLWVGGLGIDGVSLQSSMSAYYYTGMRDTFVGALCAVGVALYLYKGFSGAENLALSLAGVLAVCVALFPTRSGAEWELVNYVHVIAAVLFFGCLAYVSVFHASDTLSLIRDTRRARVLQRWYFILGALMITSPLLALAAAWIVDPPLGRPSIVFFLEAFGAWAFAAYWLVKSWELKQTSADRAAAQGILLAVPTTSPTPVPGRLIQTAPLDESVDELKRRIGL